MQEQNTSEEKMKSMPRRAHDAMRPLQQQTALVVLIAFFFGAMTGYFYASERCNDVIKGILRVSTAITEKREHAMNETYQRKLQQYIAENPSVSAFSTTGMATGTTPMGR